MPRRVVHRELPEDLAEQVPSLLVFLPPLSGFRPPLPINSNVDAPPYIIDVDEDDDFIDDEDVLHNDLAYSDDEDLNNDDDNDDAVVVYSSEEED
nr:hypothetical protein [Tanacetum cinerariifolium]